MDMREDFNSHPHEEDDTLVLMQKCTKTYFNSHPHEEDDGNQVFPGRWNGYFNSHPHEEDDSTQMTKTGSWRISTHILTKRMTAILNKNNLFKIAYYINNKHFISIVDIFFHFHIYFQA